MSGFHDFLTWFDGWSENIETQPTEKQWIRLRAKVAEVRNAEPAPQQVFIPGQVLQVSPPPPPVKNEAWWRAQFMEKVLEMGWDPESGHDALSDYMKRIGSINYEADDPRVAAVAAVGSAN